MNVLLIAPQPFYTERGTPIAVRRLAEALCRDGHRVDLLTYPFGVDVPIEGLTIHRCRRFPGIRHVGIGFSLAKLLMDVMLVLKLLRMGRPGRYDTIHAVEEAIYPALLLRWRHRAKVFYDMDSSLVEQMVQSHVIFRPLRPLLDFLERWAITSAAKVVPMCHDLADYAARMRASDDIVVLHDVPVQREEASNGMEPLSTDESDERHLALYVGNLESYQGIDLLVEATALLPDDCPVRVVVVGGPNDEAERFRDTAAQRGLAHRLQFVGPRPIAQLHDLLGQADILLSPRTKGGNTPLKLYSYMDAGRAILATRLRTHTQVLDESTALLVDADAEAFARGLERLVNDASLRRRLGESARRRVRRDYSVASFDDRVRTIYRRPQSRSAYVPGIAGKGLSEAVGTWDGTYRRRVGDRRRGGDRRSVARGSLDRRAGERRAFAFT